ncbi:hypothetical protein ACLOJK_039466 [Asimina triloba]
MDSMVISPGISNPGDFAVSKAEEDVLELPADNSVLQKCHSFSFLSLGLFLKQMSTSIKEEVERIRSEHPDDASAVVNDRVKGSLKVTRAFGAGFLKQPKWNKGKLSETKEMISSGTLLLLRSFLPVGKRLRQIPRVPGILCSALQFMWILGNPIKIEGAEFSNTRAIYICNHASPIDLFLLMWLTPTGTVGIAKKEFAETTDLSFLNQIIFYPLIGQLFYLANHQLIDRSNRAAAIQTMKEWAAFLFNIHPNTAWPAYLTGAPRKLQVARAIVKDNLSLGFVHVALDTRLPIVPIVLVGTHRAWRKGSLHVRPAPLVVKYLPPIKTDEWTADKVEEYVKMVHDLYVRHLPESQRPLDNIPSLASPSLAPQSSSCSSTVVLARAVTGGSFVHRKIEKVSSNVLQGCNLLQSSRKETVLDLAKFVDKGVQVKLTGGRQAPAVTGTLKGYDQLLNLVLDEAIEFLRDPDDPLKTSDQTRCIGLIVCRGTAVMLVSPTDGTDEIANPFLQPDGA